MSLKSFVSCGSFVLPVDRRAPMWILPGAQVRHRRGLQVLVSHVQNDEPPLASTLHLLPSGAGPAAVRALPDGNYHAG